MLELAPSSGPQVGQKQPGGMFPVKSNDSELLRKMVCLFVAEGRTMAQTMEHLGVSEQEVRTIMAQKESVELIIKYQSDASKTPQERVKKMAGLALDVQTRLLLSPTTTDAIKAKVAQDVADRGMGKATVFIETKNLNVDLSDVIELDRALSAQTKKLEQVEEIKKRLVATAAQPPLLNSIKDS